MPLSEEEKARRAAIKAAEDAREKAEADKARADQELYELRRPEREAEERAINEAAAKAWDDMLRPHLEALTEAGFIDVVIEQVGPLWRVRATRKVKMGESSYSVVSQDLSDAVAKALGATP
jgi:hypothetical protein